MNMALPDGHPARRQARVAHERSQQTMDLLKQNLLGDKVRKPQITTEEVTRKLEILPAFSQHEYTLFMVMDRTLDVPKCILWAYAEKAKNGRDFLFAFGKGNPDDGMAVTDCALIAFTSSASNADIDEQEIKFTVGGEIDDLGVEIRLKRELKNGEFASRISIIAQGDQAGRTVSMFSGTLDDLVQLAEPSVPASPEQPEEVEPATLADVETSDALAHEADAPEPSSDPEPDQEAPEALPEAVQPQMTVQVSTPPPAPAAQEAAQPPVAKASGGITGTGDIDGLED